MTTRTRARDLTLLLEASRRLNRTLYLDSLLVEIRDLVREAVSAETAIVVAASGASALPSPCSLWLTFTVSPMIV